MKQVNSENIFGIKLPIIQAPMAGIQDSALAIAVARAGGLGSIPCATLSLSEIETELRIIESAIDTPINLNFFCHQPPDINVDAEDNWVNLLKPYFSELNINPDSISSTVSRASFSHDTVDVLEPFTPPILSFHFGLPSRELLDRLKGWGSTILSTATTVQEALWLQENGANMIIAQGVEAGGHRGMFMNNDLDSQSGTKELVSNILANVNLPVIAAGGISTADNVASHLDNGASAAQVGTGYLLCDEAKTSMLHRHAIQASDPRPTVLTNLFSGRPARAMVNRVIKDLGAINENAPGFPRAAIAMSTLRKVAETNNSSDFTPLWCGQNTQGCDSISAYDLTRRLASQL